MFELWTGNGILTKESMEEIESRISRFKTPAGTGRLPGRIGSCYGGFTANQWKNWILIYSVVALKGLLPSSHMGCWLLYVNACKMLCKPKLKKDNKIAADMYLLQFCRKFEFLYGKDNCTPSMHLHLHLKECLLDYGPAHAFWCFGFERYNGIMGSYHTNQKAVECQFIKKFLKNQSIHCIISKNHPLQQFFPMKRFEEYYESHFGTISENSLDAMKCKQRIEQVLSTLF